ncbi:MAG: GNAT family N-acetyltransferase [Rhodospirillales bacterium]|nr:GNAT family N-acetyltransferase [Rhodospirillales bacterium]
MAQWRAADATARPGLPPPAGDRRRVARAVSRNPSAPSSGLAANGVRTEILAASPACAYAPLLAALQRRCFAEPWGDEAILALMATPGTAAIAATVADQPAGFALYRLVADEGEILSLGVLPERRRLGVGAALVAAVVRHAAERGVLRLVLEVAADNAAARALYAGAGFAAVGRRRGYYKSSPGQVAVDALILARRQL